MVDNINTDPPTDLDDVEREIYNVDKIKNLEREEYLAKQQRKMDREKIKEMKKKVEEIKRNKLTQSEPSNPSRDYKYSGTVPMEKSIVIGIVCLLVILLLFALFTAIFAGYGIVKDKFKSNMSINQPINSNCSLTCPVIPACPSINCGNQTYNITFTPDIDVYLNSS